MLHLDLFSGIGGFAYAVDQVWPGSEHIFCDNDKFCQQVLKKHWPNSKIYGDIREIITDTERNRWNSTPQQEVGKKEIREWRRCGFDDKADDDGTRFDILTGGFPCQPFSQAGKRRGTEDDRYLWPEMLRVIQLTKPQYIIAENVRGLLTQSGGLVFEQVCLDLEASGYEVQPLIIPAVSVNAPHRRDRVWFIAHRKSRGQWNSEQKRSRTRQSKAEIGDGNSNAQNSIGKRSRGRMENNRQVLESKSTKIKNERPGWERNWLEVATELCGVDDGLSSELDFAGWTKARHRVERLKALGNAIVPQVAIEIMKGIKDN